MEEHDDEHGWLDGAAILLAVVVVVVVSAVNDWKKERQFRSLQNKIDADHRFSVLRGGELIQLPVSELVVGDIGLVKYGTNRDYVTLYTTDGHRPGPSVDWVGLHYKFQTSSGLGCIGSRL